MRFAFALFAITVCGGLGMLFLAAMPGGEWYFSSLPGLCASLPLAAAWAFALLGLGLYEIDVRPQPEWKKWIWRTVFVALVSVALLYLDAPQRILFWIYREDLSTLAAAGATESPQRVGPYLVHEVRVDGQGGVYLRTARSSRGLAPSSNFHGFAYRPNVERSPFGEVGYELRPLGGDWYLFEVRND